ncbi:MAG: TRAP transporter substrate-binding protein [Thermodesulfobacteriota bacterium]
MISINKKVFLILTLIFLVSVISVHAEQLKFAHTMSISDTMHQGVLKFAELVKAKTNGQLEIVVYPAGQLGNDAQILQGVRMGSIDIAMTGNPFHTTFEPSLNVLDLPFLFKDFSHAYRVFDGPIGKEILSRLEKHNIKGLGFMEIGFRNLTNSKRPVKEAADMKGLKIRVTPNPAHIAAFKLLGAIPTPMPFTEVYMALKTGAVDGQENPTTLIHGQKFYEVQKYMSITMHAYTVSEVSMNLKRFQSLSSAHQNVLLEALQEAAIYHRKLNRDLEGKLLKEMEEKGLQVIKDLDRDSFAKLVSKPVQEEYAAKFGWELVNKIVAAGK